MNAKSIEEMEEIAKGDVNLEHSVEYVKRYLNGPLNHTIEDYIAEKEYVAHKEGERCGENKRNIEIAKNLLGLDIDIKDIKKATGLTDKELDKLKD